MLLHLDPAHTGPGARVMKIALRWHSKFLLGSPGAGFGMGLGRVQSLQRIKARSSYPDVPIATCDGLQPRAEVPGVGSESKE